MIENLPGKEVIKLERDPFRCFCSSVISYRMLLGRWAFFSFVLRESLQTRHLPLSLFYPLNSLDPSISLLSLYPLYSLHLHIFQQKVAKEMCSPVFSFSQTNSSSPYPPSSLQPDDRCSARSWHKQEEGRRSPRSIHHKINCIPQQVVVSQLVCIYKLPKSPREW